MVFVFWFFFFFFFFLQMGSQQKWEGQALVIAGTKMETEKRESNYVNCNFGEALRIFNLHTVFGSTLSSCLER